MDYELEEYRREAETIAPGPLTEELEDESWLRAENYWHNFGPLFPSIETLDRLLEEARIEEMLELHERS
jgi:hypothetical protein